MVNKVTLVGTWLPRVASHFFPDLLWRVADHGRAAYLTFDDGPNPDVTGELLEVLDRFDAKATFFVIGRKAELRPDLVRRILDGGHSIGNHTYSHPDAWRTSTPQIIDELERTTKLLEDIAGARVNWMRPPYGRFTGAMREWCVARGQKLTMWDVGPGDYLEQVGRADVERHVRTYLRSGSILVLHDNPRCAETTPAALETLLRELSNEGWEFPPLSSELHA